MMNKRRAIKGLFFCFLIAVCFLGAAPKAYAYLDPGVGTFIVQMLVAFLVGIAMTLKVFWARVVRLIQSVKNRFKKNP